MNTLRFALGLILGVVLVYLTEPTPTECQQGIETIGTDQHYSI